MKTKIYTLIFILMVSVFAVILINKTNADNPITYAIGTCADLANLPNIGTDYDTYVITNDLDCSGISFEPLSWEDEVSLINTPLQTPIAQAAGIVKYNGFTGTLDGQGYSISNFSLDYSGSDNIALFKALGEGAVVKNINFVSGEVNGGNNVALIATSASDDVTISNIQSDINIDGLNYVGGLIAMYYGEKDSLNITNCMISGDVSGLMGVGGLIGVIESYFTDSFNLNISHNVINAAVYSVDEEESTGAVIGGLIGGAILSFANDSSNLNGEFNLVNNTISYNNQGVSGYDGWEGEGIGGIIGFLAIENYSDTNNLTINLGPNNEVQPEIKGFNGIGGLIGIIEVYDESNLSGAINIFQNHSTSIINGVNGTAGGLVGGINLDLINNNGFSVNMFDNYYQNTVYGRDQAGGLIGAVVDNNKTYPLLYINRNYVAGAVASLSLAGGLVGSWDVIGEINDSFIISPLLHASTTKAVVIGSGNEADVSLNNVFYDQSNHVDMPTVGASFADGVTGVNVGGSDATYFINNTTNPPFAEEDGTAIWDFRSVWQEDAYTYPTLKEFSLNIPTVYVDDDYSEASAGGHSWGIDAYDNLEDALIAVAVDGTINIAAGDYAVEDDPINITKEGISIIGPGFNEDEAERATFSFTATNNLTIVANDVTISGLYLELLSTSGRGFDYVLGSMNVDGSIIENNDITASADGIGIIIFNDPDATVSLSATIRNNVLRDSSIGFLATGNGTHLITGNTIKSNAQFGIITGFMFGGDLGGTEISNNEIFDNSGGIAIIATNSDTLPIGIGPNNDIHDNSMGLMIYGDINKININYNKIYNNTKAFGEMGAPGPGLEPSGVLISDHSTTLNITHNWWGNDNGPTITSNTNGIGDLISIADNEAISGPIFYRPFYRDEDLSILSTLNTNLSELSNYFDVGSIIIRDNEDFDDASVISTAEDVNVAISDNGGISSVTLPLGTNISRNDLQNMSIYNLALNTVATSTLGELPVDEIAYGSLQWGLEGSSLNFSQAINVNIYVGTDLNGETLNVLRSTDGSGSWTNEGIARPNTCVVAEGICSFGATKASVYVATKIPEVETDNTTSQTVQRGGGSSSIVIKPSAIQIDNLSLRPLSFTINNNESTTDSSLLNISMNGDPRTVNGYAISLNQNFNNAAIQAYTDHTTFSIPNINGVYPIYLKYYSPSGHSSDTISRSITLNNSSYKAESIASSTETEMSVIAREKNLNKTINQALTQRLAGRILLQVEEKGEAWYVNPSDGKKTFLGRPSNAFQLMRSAGQGITNESLSKIPIGILDNISSTDKDTDDDGLSDRLEAAIGSNPNNKDSDGDGYPDALEVMNNYSTLNKGKMNIDLNFVNKQKGKIFIQVESHGEVWYVDPVIKKRYYLGLPADAYQLMRSLALGISNNDIRQIEVAETK